MLKSPMQMNVRSPRKKNGFGRNTQGNGMMVSRASELPSPSVNGHPLEVFGQSDRLSRKR